MRVETATQNRGWTWRLGLVGIQSENAGVSRFRVQKDSALVLPHPERGSLNCVNLQGHPETEQTAMRVAMDPSPSCFS